jgi:DNA-binding MarR family transcriptional regulator
MGKKSKGKDKARKARRKAERLAVAAPMVTMVGKPEVEATAAEADPAVAAIELASRLAGLSTVLQRHLARGRTGDGLTRARLSALGLLVMGGPRTLGELAAAEHVRPPTMTRLVHALEADGLVRRRPNPDDRRSVVIAATPRGEELLEAGRRRQVEPLAEAIAGLERSDRRTLEQTADVLGRVLRSVPWEPVERTE